MQLAERCDVVDAGIGSRIGEHDESFAYQNSAAIGHGWRAPRRDFYTGGSVCGNGGCGFVGGLLIDPDGDRRAFLAGPVAGAAYWRGAERIEPDGDPHVGFGWADAIDGIEADPAALRHVGFGPGMPAAFRRGAAAQIAGDVAGRNLQAAGGADKDVGEVAGFAALVREGLGSRRRRRLRRVMLANELFMQTIEQRVQLR